MTIENFIKKIAEKLEAKINLPFFLIGQNQDTDSLLEFGTFQILEINRDLNNRKSLPSGEISKFWNFTLQINVFVKNKENLRFKDIDLITKITQFLSKEYYFEDELEPKINYPMEISKTKDMTQSKLQSTIYGKSIDVTFTGQETYFVENVPIDKVSGNVIEEVTRDTSFVEVIDA